MSAPTAEVAVPVPLRQTFHYRVPEDLAATAVPGARVLVRFGPRKVVGYVVARDTEPPPGVRLQPLLEVLDARPTFPPELLVLTAFIARYYRAPIGEVLKGAHPPGTNARGVPGVGRAEAPTALDDLPPDEAALLRQLPVDGEPRPLAELDAASDALVRRLVERGWLARHSVVRPPEVKVSTVRAVRAVAPAPAEPRGPGGRPLRRDEIHAWLVGRGAVPVRAIAEQFKSPRAHVKRLVDEGALVEEQLEVIRDPFFGATVAPDTPPALNAAQARATERIIAAEGYAAFLLQGITGSGKTEVYLRAIEAALARGEGALVLVPEIALTPQLVQRFRARLGDDLAVLHSGLSRGARYDQWRRLRAGEVRLAIGARSGLFAPVRDLGLVIVDEEHDPSYKQHDGVRYHARDMALMRAAQQGARVVLGSATPSLESAWNAQQGKLTRLILPDRATGGELPAVELVDLREQKLDPQAPFLSTPLRTALADTLARRAQAILFLNRRGYSNFVLCRACGQTIECDHCAISMTWHQRRRQLRCHYCDAARPFPDQCPSCERGPLELPGRGTERVEEALGTLFPAARVARMDRDTTGGRKLIDQLAAMRDREIDILVGTQMVTKGHDFPDVTLVGVLDADAGLKFPDLRAAERTFQLLTQVAGRAGRGRRAGKVLVQTHDPEHPCLQAVRTHDHARFATHELEVRRMFGFPPFTHAVTVRLDGRDARLVERTAARLADHLRAALAGALAEVRLRGPAPASIPVLRGRTRFALLLTCPKRDPLHRALRALDPVEADLPGDLRLVVDVDPHDFS